MSLPDWNNWNNWNNSCSKLYTIASMKISIQKICKTFLKRLAPAIDSKKLSFVNTIRWFVRSKHDVLSTLAFSFCVFPLSLLFLSPPSELPFIYPAFTRPTVDAFRRSRKNDKVNLTLFQMVMLIVFSLINSPINILGIHYRYVKLAVPHCRLQVFDMS